MKKHQILATFMSAAVLSSTVAPALPVQAAKDVKEGSVMSVDSDLSKAESDLRDSTVAMNEAGKDRDSAQEAYDAAKKDYEQAKADKDQADKALEDAHAKVS